MSRHSSVAQQPGLQATADTPAKLSKAPTQADGCAALLCRLLKMWPTQIDLILQGSTGQGQRSSGRLPKRAQIGAQKQGGL
jgi:hypothetical protein